MSFGELMKLKEQLGAKKYDEAMFGSSSSSTSRNINPNRSFKRANKNRFVDANNFIISFKYIKK